MHVTKLFSPSDLDDIRSAVREVERKTSGEVVPYVVGASDPYDDAGWKAAALGALLCVLGAALLHELGGFWGGWVAAWITAPALGGGALGYLAAVLVPSFRRFLIAPETLAHRVALRADAAFLREEVFDTRDRTGVLVFLSLFERRVMVLADTGITAKVEQKHWDGVVEGIVKGIRAGEPGKALREGILRCGEILVEHGVAIRPGDRDELPDELRVEDR